jgi:hypothetical protein
MPKKKSRKKRSNSRRVGPRFVSRARSFITKHLIALISILTSISISFVIYYLSYSEPDIRGIHGVAPIFESCDTTTDEVENSVVYCIVRFRFKNFSIKNGYIDKVELVPRSIQVPLKIEIKHIEKEVLNWREEKEVRLHFSYIVTPYISDLMTTTGKKILLDVIPYDNTGKLIKLDDEGAPLEITYTVGLQEEH